MLPATFVEDIFVLEYLQAYQVAAENWIPLDLSDDLRFLSCNSRVDHK